MSRIGKPIEKEIRLAVARGWGEWARESAIGYRVPFGNDDNVLN